jgi:hypothetical protein
MAETTERCPNCDRIDCLRNEPMPANVRAAFQRVIDAGGRATRLDRMTISEWGEATNARQAECDREAPDWRARVLAARLWAQGLIDMGDTDPGLADLLTILNGGDL